MKRWTWIPSLAALAGATHANAAPTAFRPLSDPERALIQQVVAESLNDPQSARFLWAPVAVNEGNGKGGYCAQLSANNQFGGRLSEFYSVRIVYTAGVITTASDPNIFAGNDGAGLAMALATHCSLKAAESAR